MTHDDFPSGYFGCCGMSRARGHADLCHRAVIVVSGAALAVYAVSSNDSTDKIAAMKDAASD